MIEKLFVIFCFISAVFCYGSEKLDNGFTYSIKKEADPGMGISFTIKHFDDEDYFVFNELMKLKLSRLKCACEVEFSRSSHSSYTCDLSWGLALSKEQLGSLLDRIGSLIFEERLDESIYAGSDVLSDWSLEELTNIYKSWARVDCAKISIYGDLDEMSARKLIRERFSKYKRGYERRVEEESQPLIYETDLNKINLIIDETFYGLSILMPEYRVKDKVRAREIEPILANFYTSSDDIRTRICGCFVEYVLSQRLKQEILNQFSSKICSPANSYKVLFKTLYDWAFKSMTFTLEDVVNAKEKLMKRKDNGFWCTVSDSGERSCTEQEVLSIVRNLSLAELNNSLTKFYESLRNARLVGFLKEDKMERVIDEAMVGWSFVGGSVCGITPSSLEYVDGSLFTDIVDFWDSSAESCKDLRTMIFKDLEKMILENQFSKRVKINARLPIYKGYSIVYKDVIKWCCTPELIDEKILKRTKSQFRDEINAYEGDDYIDSEEVMLSLRELVIDGKIDPEVIKQARSFLKDISVEAINADLKYLADCVKSGLYKPLTNIIPNGIQKSDF